MDESLPQERAIARSALNKASWRIFPLLGLGYLIAFMDRTNVSFAALQMNADLKFSATIYGLGAGLFFLSYSLFEIPSNLLLMRYGARRWIARIMITWGLLAAGMMFVRTPMQFYVLRFLTGLAEAGFFPGVVLYLTHWFPQAQRARAISGFFLFMPLSAVVMGTLSVWLLALDGIGALRGWQWLFLVEGIPAVLAGLAILFFLPSAPSEAGWLSEPERRWLCSAMARDADRIGEPSHAHVLASLRDPNVRWLAAMFFLTGGIMITVNLSAPAVLKEVAGLPNGNIGYLVSLGGIIGALSMLATGWLADRRNDRFTPLLVALPVQALAVLVIALAPSPMTVVFAYLAFAASSGAVNLSQVSIWADVFHVRVVGVCGAAINTVAQIGSFLAPFAFGAARDATGGYHAGLLALSLGPLLALIVSIAFIRRLGGQSAKRLKVA